MNNKSKPEVSVIIATYNRAHVITRAIRSVLNQTYQDFELIIVDGASTDNTEEVVKNFNDVRIRYIRQEINKGPQSGRNTGIKAATGEYIAFQDSDDEWLSEKLEKQMNVFQRVPSKVGMVYTSLYRIGKGGIKLPFKTPTIMPEDGFVYKEALDYKVLNIQIGTAVIRRKCFERVGLLDERLPAFDDLELFIRLSKYYCFYHIDEPLVNYYATEGSFGSNQKNVVAARKIILEKYFDDIKKNRRTLAKHYFLIGFFHISNNEIEIGRSYLVKAAKAYPFNIKVLSITLLSFFGQDAYNKVVELYRKIKKCYKVVTKREWKDEMDKGLIYTFLKGDGGNND